MARFANAQSLRSGPQSFMPPLTGKLVEMQKLTSGPVDYVAFCNSVAATICLYYPPDSLFIEDYKYDPGFWQTADFYLGDAGVCAATGGVHHEGGGTAWCAWRYPKSAQRDFNPGVPPPGQPIGAGVTFHKACPAGFHTHYSNKGSVHT